MIEIIRATETWQKAGAYYVRIEAMVKGLKLPLLGEFDEHDTPDTLYTVIIDDGLPIGTCRLFQVNETTAKIERVCVLEEYRNKGIGRKLIIETEKWLKELGINKIIITSRDEAVGFYERLGYKVDWNQVETGGIFTIVYTEKEI